MAALVTAAALMGGCASDGSPLQTASVAQDKAAEAKMAKVDPACIQLSSQIETLRHDESLARLEKAASGKSSNVQVKRASLAKQAELNKANMEFQAKCGPKIPVQAAAAPATAGTTAQVAPIAAQQQATAAQPAAAAATAAKAPAAAAATAGQ
ncbi:MAG: hypothetical protein ACRCS9_00620 [Hyphomicrobium sp.]